MPPQAAKTTETATTAVEASTVPLVTTEKWKKDFGAVDLTMGVFMGTAFVFLTLIDYSFDAYIYSQVTPYNCKASNPLIQSLATFYQWRLVGSPLLPFWDLFVLCLLPLIIFSLVKDNIDTLRGIRAPLGRHILDLESLAQLVATMTIVATKAKPATEKFVFLVNQARDSTDSTNHDVNVFGELTQLLNFHFLVFGLNALQWFVPFLRLMLQQKQDQIKSKEASNALIAANKAAVAAAKLANKIAAAAGPSAEEMASRMKAAEGLIKQDEQTVSDSHMRKRK